MLFNEKTETSYLKGGAAPGGCRCAADVHEIHVTKSDEWSCLTDVRQDMDLRVLMVFLSLCSSAPVPEQMRLVSGSSSCSGTLEVLEGGRWRTVLNHEVWSLSEADEACMKLGCGSALSLQRVQSLADLPMDYIEDMYEDYRPSHFFTIEINCSDTLRLAGGASRCSGRLEVRSGQRWSSVCADHLHRGDAELGCRELNCGPLLAMSAELHEGQMSLRAFGCKGDESALSSCGRSDADACVSGKVAVFTCSESDAIRLVQGSSRCAGKLEMRRFGEWKPVDFWWHLKLVDVVCRQLNCGSAVSSRKKRVRSRRPVWGIMYGCDAGSLEKCVARPENSVHSVEITCSGTVRLLEGTNMCSGRLEVKWGPRSWSPLCADGFHWWDAQVACRQLGCGAPSALQGGLFGEAASPFLVSTFQCDGSESTLWDCELKSPGDTCAAGSAVGLTCSDGDEVQLVGGASHCSGQLVLKHNGEQRPVSPSDPSWSLRESQKICKLLDCGSAVSTRMIQKTLRVWRFDSSCFLSNSTLRECVTENHGGFGTNLEISCSDFLARPTISASALSDGASEQQGHLMLRGSNFVISCSVEPQFHGGVFQLVFSGAAEQSLTLPAVNHSASFLFMAAGHAHQGHYRCLYHINYTSIFSTSAASESQMLHLTIAVSLTELLIRLSVHLLVVLLLISASCFYVKRAGVGA